MTDSRNSELDETRYYFDPLVAGKRVQADGGNAAVGSRLGSREMFEGTLTGQRMDQGDPPWRWLEIGDLTGKPAEFSDERVWCEESYIYAVNIAINVGAHPGNQTEAGH